MGRLGVLASERAVWMETRLTGTVWNGWSASLFFFKYFFLGGGGGRFLAIGRSTFGCEISCWIQLKTWQTKNDR